jgi:dextranase
MKRRIDPVLKKIVFVIFLLCIFSFALAGPFIESVTIDKARYSPDEAVRFELSLEADHDGATLNISYFHLNDKIENQSVLVNSDPMSWTWKPPQDDFKGYLAEIILQNGSSPVDTTWIAVDVSSDWSKFPRYGFLSYYPQLDIVQIDNVISELNRHHINGLQFYDWQYKHHLPLKGTSQNPASTWKDIANRTNFFSTIDGYIKAAHRCNMQTMAYNLLYGAYWDAALDGVANEWRLFQDQAHSRPDFHDLPDNWASDIYLIDPSNPQWVDYIITRMKDAFNALDFDGWHVDQLGDRGTLYNYAGQEATLPGAFLPFLQQSRSILKTALVMNAVNQYGQQDIARSPVDVLYTEVWSPNDTYSDLVSMILHNNTLSDGKLATVLAAYVNKGLSSARGLFNTPAVLLTDAVIFAAGGAHLELGEHMLANEYFPNDNLRMSTELHNKLISYYDFLTAYQNLLRDGGDFNNVNLQSENNISIRSISRRGSVWSFSKLHDHRQIFHLINFKDATSLNWRDDDGQQPEPRTIVNCPVYFIAQKAIKSLWLASPDVNGGSVNNLAFTQQGDTIRFMVPSLKYWDMIVADYEPSSRVDHVELICPQKMILYGVYPNPFNSTVKIGFALSDKVQVKMEIYNVMGEHIITLVKNALPAGEYWYVWRPQENQSTGVYVVVLRAEKGMCLTQKLLYLK